MLSPSGGLAYHLRAFRYANTLWAPHSNNVRLLLESWDVPTSKPLLLVGPSGGYSLESAWLQKFKDVHVFEPDFLARLILKKRNPDVDFHFHAQGLRTSVQLREFPGSPILFCNLLGQRRTALPGFRELTEGRPWLSYHDVLSGKDFAFNDNMHYFGPRLGMVEIKKLIEPLRAGQNNIELINHETLNLFTAKVSRLWLWQLRPGVFHLIEGLLSNVG